MSKERGIRSLDDIQEDLAATQKLQSRRDEVEAWEDGVLRAAGPVRTAGPSGAGAAGVGRRLVQRCAEVNRRRYETLLHFERHFPPDDDRGFLIVPACQILESEVKRLVTDPARGIAAALEEALRAEDEDRPRAEVLRAWAGGQVPTTLGTQWLVLLALRRGVEQELAPVTRFLKGHFTDRYAELLATRRLGAGLDAIRSEFRNPACHGEGPFDANAYGVFVELMVARARFADWDTHGPGIAEPDAGIGVFYHHLSQALEPEKRPPPRPG